MSCIDCKHCYNSEICTLRDEPIVLMGLCFMFDWRKR